MIEAILVMFGIGAACGLTLSVASKVFYVYEILVLSMLSGTWPGQTAAAAVMQDVPLQRLQLLKARPFPLSAWWPELKWKE